MPDIWSLQFLTRETTLLNYNTAMVILQFKKKKVGLHFPPSKLNVYPKQKGYQAQTACNPESTTKKRHVQKVVSPNTAQMTPVRIYSYLFPSRMEQKCFCLHPQKWNSLCRAASRLQSAGTLYNLLKKIKSRNQCGKLSERYDRMSVN